MSRRRNMNPQGDQPRPADPELTLEQKYVATFGKKPHHKMKPETIRERIADATEITGVRRS